MSNPTNHSARSDTLDASVDSLVGRMDAASSDARGAAATIVPETDMADPSIGAISAGAAGVDSDQRAAVSLLSEISADIEHVAPGALPVPPAPRNVPPQRVPPSVAAASVLAQSDHGDVEEPSETDHSPVPAASLEATESVTPPGPGPEIQRLDAALAASAERVLAQAQDDLEEAPSLHAQVISPAHQSQSESPTPASPAPAFAAHAESTPVSVPAKASVVIEAPVSEPVVADRPGVLAPLRLKTRELTSVVLRPIAAMHEQLSEATRQTIGYCALITVFFAVCFWSGIYFFKKNAFEPVTKELQFYDDSIPAHGVTAPPRTEHADAKSPHAAKGGHGEGGDSHGAPAKSAKKAASGHGEAKASDDAHGAKKPAGASKSKKASKADAHGGH